MSEFPNQQPPAGRRPNALRHTPLLLVSIVLVVIIIGIVVAYVLAQQDDESPATDVAASTPVTPVLTMVPPTEPPTEVALQEQLHDWLLTVPGVEDVQSLDVDTPEDEPPLIYAELTVEPGYNNSGIPAVFAARVNEALLTTQYSDFVIIVDDGAQVVEYTLNSETSSWDETVLSAATSVTAPSN